MVVLVTASPVFSLKNNFVKALRKKHPEITTVIQNINGRGTSMVLGDKEHVLYGKGYIEDVLCGYRFKISPKSFYQVNPVQTEILYKKAIEVAGLTGKERVIDAYCGIGTIGIVASKHTKEVIGVELNKDAVKDAVENAKINGVKNIRFFCNDAGKFMVNMAEKGEKAEVVFLDPPRSGSIVELIHSVAILNPQKVVYVSCDPETLARDLGIFKKKGYESKKAWGVDLFPATEHVETVVLLSDKRIDGHVDIDLDVEKLPLKPKRATYKEIKAYIKGKYNLDVSSLYIAQIKDRVGIKNRENYNVGSGKGKNLVCPKDKEKAIKEAFNHFGLI